MSRRTSLPGADELFRTTGGDQREGGASDVRTSPEDPRDRHGDASPARTSPDQGRPAGAGLAQVAGSQPVLRTPDGPDGSSDLLDGDLRTTPVRHTGVRRRARTVGERRPSGRERHEEKITVYVSNEELMDLEHARLGLRGDHGLAVDRGRIVREALAVVLADFEAKGETSILVRRLTGR